MFFYLLLGTMVAGDVFWAIHVRRLRRGPRVLALTWAAFQIAGLTVILLSRHDWAVLGEALPRWAHGAIVFWHLAVLLPWLVWRGSLLAGRTVVGLSRQLARVPPRDAARRAPAPAGWSRREFLALAPPALTLGAAAWSETQLDDFRVRRLDVIVRDLPVALEGLTIAHVSDLHVGRFTRGRILEKVTETVNALEADVIALTGDLINDSLRAMPPSLELVRALKARHAVVACEGNHDLIDNPAEFWRQAERGGLPLLRDDTTSVTIRGQRVQFLGVRWEGKAGPMAESTRALLAKRDPGAWPLLLAHHPHAWDAAAEEIPLTLAGHTHGGQLMLGPDRPLLPGMFRYWSGIYQRNGSSLVVSNGVGNWFPLRINAPAEVVHLTLRRPAAS